MNPLDSVLFSLRYQQPRELSDEDSKRTFTESETEVSVLTLTRDTKTQPTHGANRYIKYPQTFTDSKVLLSSLTTQKGSSPPPFKIFYLRQRDTWDRVLLPSHAFQDLCTHMQASSSLVELACNFGRRLESRDEIHISLAAQDRIHCVDVPSTDAKSPQKNQKQTRATEIRYNVRYFARHGRPGVRSSWSERQAGVFHSFNEDTMSSQLVTIQLPEKARHEVEDLLCRVVAADEDLHLEHHLACHVPIFSHLAADWRPYLCFLEALLAELEVPALNSKVGVGGGETHSLTFKNAQRLERLRGKIVKARHILLQNAEVMRRWIKAVETLALHLGRGKEVRVLVASGREYIAELDSHRAVVVLLLQRLSGMERLNYHTLSFRNEEQVIRSTLPLNSGNEKLIHQLSHLSSRHDSVHDMASDFASDSKLMKILTFIAVLYAPASFATSILNTNVVTTVPVLQDAPRTRLVLATGFWILPALVLGLVVATLAGTWAWCVHGPRLWPRKVPRSVPCERVLE